MYLSGYHTKYTITLVEMSHSDCRKYCKQEGGDLLYVTYEKFLGVNSGRLAKRCTFFLCYISFLLIITLL